MPRLARVWPTRCRSELFNHTSQRPILSQAAIRQRWPLNLVFQFGADLPASCGAIVGRGQLVDCQPLSALRHRLSLLERALVEVGTGVFVWVMTDLEWFEQPVPRVANQLLFRLPPEVRRSCRRFGHRFGKKRLGEA
jgi:hypothetical protein